MEDKNKQNDKQPEEKKSTELVKGQSFEISSPQQFSFFNPEQFAVMQRVAGMFANSELVPDMYKVTEKNPKDKAVANCIIAIDMANRIGASALMVMQNLVIIYGRPSWSSKFLISTVNTCGRFETLKFKFASKGKLRGVKYTSYEWQGGNKKAVEKTFDQEIDNVECIAYTTAKGSTTPLESSPITIEMAIKEGWYTKAGSKWQTMPKQMLMYRAASFWTSAYAPELSMGMKTEDETRDIEEVTYEEITEQEINQNANKVPIDIQVKEPEKPKQPEKKKETVAAEPTNGKTSGELFNNPGY
jgi:hypothetical protein